MKLSTTGLLRIVKKCVRIVLLVVVVSNGLYAQTVDEQVLMQRKQLQEQGQKLKAQQQFMQTQVMPMSIMPQTQGIGIQTQQQPIQTLSGAAGIMPMQGSLSSNPNTGSIHVNRDLNIRKYSPTELVEKIFVKGGACSSISNVQLRSHGWDIKQQKWTDEDLRGLGYFSRGDSNFEFAEGLVLSTGGLNSIEGSNISVSGVGNINMESDYPFGDTDLQGLIQSNYSVHNVSILEFDFVPTKNNIQFSYVFASEEYANFVNQGYNDVFGFFISGSGISGTKNIALLPNNMPVSIDNVNNGHRWYNTHNCPTIGAGINRNYYINIPIVGEYYEATNTCSNKILTTDEIIFSQSMEFNGRTVKLTATATVIPCQTYHIKLAIGNVSDTGFQSGVFLEAKSFDIDNFNIINYGNSIEGANTIFRGCTNNKLVVRRPTAGSAETINLSYSGIVNGSDISRYPNGGALPTSVTIPAGQLSVEIPYQVHITPAGNKTLTITGNCPCGGTGFSKKIQIYDNAEFQVAASPSCQGEANGKITISPKSGKLGSGNYESSIDGGKTWKSLANYTGLVTGNYIVRLRDVGSCVETTHNVTIGSLNVDAGSNQLGHGVFTMNAQPLASGEKGTWTVVSGSATITNPLSPTTNVKAGSSSVTLRWTVITSECEMFDDITLSVIECNNCPASFAPISGQKYVFSAWVQDEKALTEGKPSYVGCSAVLNFDLLDGTVKSLPPIPASGAIIDGWQRMQEVVEIPADAYSMSLELVNNTSTDNVYFDDIRMFPFNGNMKSYVYDPITRRLVAELDDENYATFYEYDEEGALIRVKKETERGVMTIREARQAQRKKPTN